MILNSADYICVSHKKTLSLENLKIYFLTCLDSLRCNVPLFTSIDVLLTSYDVLFTKKELCFNRKYMRKVEIVLFVEMYIKVKSALV